MQLSENGLNLIKGFEQFRSSPYPDVGGVATIGYGTIVYPDGTKVTLSDSDISEQDAEQYLQSQISIKVNAVNAMLSVELNQNQFDALVSFTYNLGTHALQGSHLLTYVNQGDFNAASGEFHKWDHVGGHQVAGLTRRRLAEEQLFLTPA